MNLKVLLVDDHTLVRKGFRALLLNNYPSWEITEAENGVQAILACSATRFDIVLMDYDMPKLDGLTAARQIVRSCPGVRILIISMHNSEELALRLRDSGVMGIVKKDAGDQEFLAAIGQVRNGIKHFPDAVMSAESERPDKGSSKRIPEKSGLAALSAREAEIFRLLAAGKAPNIIAETLCISVKTLDTHKMSIFRKCGVHSLPELVRFAYQHNAV